MDMFMQDAIAQAQFAAQKGEIPVGAVIVKDGAIIAMGYNLRETRQDATLHAEMVAIQEACKVIGNWRLNDCDLYVTLEPCPMCAGALIQSRIRRLYYGANDPKAGCCGTVMNILDYRKFNHCVEVISGIMENECEKLLSDFFVNRRKHE